MRVILLAAGIGSRISRFTKKPKSTLDVGGVPLIVRTVDLLLEMGMDVTIVLGFEKNEIIQLLGDRKVDICYNPFYRVTNSLGSLWFARDFIHGDVVIANADVYFDVDMLKMLLDDDNELVMLSDKSTAQQGDYFFKLDGNRIINYGKELDQKDRDAEYVGLARIKSSFSEIFYKHLCSMVEREQYNMWWEDVLYEYSKEYPIYVLDVSSYFWAEIDYMDDYKRITKYVETKNVAYKYNESLQNGD